MYVLPRPTCGTALPVYGGLPHHDLSSSEEVISSVSHSDEETKCGGLQLLRFTWYFRKEVAVSVHAS